MYGRRRTYTRRASYTRSSRSYTPAQKAAYYKKKYMQQRFSGQGAYRVSHAAANYGALRGRGGYYDSGFVKGMNKYIPRGSMAMLGGALGGPLGRIAGSALSTLAGFGEYKLKRNTVATKISEGQDPARMHSMSSDLRVTHREYIVDIISSSSANTFQNQAFPINPGLFQSFPWLASIAQQFEEYRIEGMVFEYKPLTGTAIASSTNPTMGGVIMATDYNSINGQFVNKQQMDNTEYTTSTPIYGCVYHPIECDPRTNPLNTLYVRGGAVPGNSDQRMYDLGIFQIATFGVQGTSVVCGELWCSYDVVFSKPISTSALGQDVLTDHFALGTVTNAHPLGTTSALRAGSSIGGTITSGTTYNFPTVFQEGTFLVTAGWFGGAVNWTPATLTPTNCTISQIWLGDAAPSLNCPNSASNTTAASQVFVVVLTGLNASIAFSGATLPTSVSNGDLVVTQFDSNITS